MPLFPASLTVPINPQIVTTRCGLFNSSRLGTASGRNDLRIENRQKMYTGKVAVSQLQVGVDGYALSSSVGELLLGNDFTYEGAIELLSPVCYEELFFGVTNLPNVAQGQPILLSNPVGLNIAANSSLWMRQGVSISSSADTLPSCSQGNATGDVGFISPVYVSQVPGTGLMTSPSGGTAFGGPNAPVILGIPVAPMPSVGFIGDSIADGNGDVINSLGSKGFVARGLESVNGSPQPYGRQTIGSWTFAKCTIDTAPRLRAWWPYMTHIIIQLGTNDIVGNGSNLAAMQTFATNIATAAKAIIGPYGKPLQVAFCTLMPRTASTDSWATAANQTPASGMGVGQTRDTYNAWLKAQVGGGLIDAVIDVNPYVEDQSNPGKWLTNGTPNYPTIDGVHPTTALHILAATAVNAWAANIAP